MLTIEVSEVQQVTAAEWEAQEALRKIIVIKTFADKKGIIAGNVH